LFPLYGPYRNSLRLQRAATEEITQNKPAAAVFIPNRLFLLAGSEQFFTPWSYSYLRTNYRTDAYLALDPGGEVQTVPGSVLPAGYQMMASLLVRKSP